MAATVVVVIALAAIGAGNKPAPGANTDATLPAATLSSSGGVIAHLGQPVTIQGVTITILKGETSAGGEFLKPPAGSIWIGYLINIKALEDNRLVNIADWTALADGNRQGQWTFTGQESWTPTLSLAEVRNGASAEGWIEFEVPKPSTFIRLVYDPNFFSSDAKITLDLTVK